MKIERMRSIPTSRGEMERNLFLLEEKMKSGKFFIAQGMTHTIDGLRRLRNLPNGRVDLLSLDEMTRLSANMMANASQHISQSDEFGERDAQKE